MAIARALTMEPKVLLFDEPTSALDPTLVGEVLNVMEELAHEGATMIVVTHEMAFAREAADRVYFIEEGVFLEVGPPEQVIDNPRIHGPGSSWPGTLGAAHGHEGGAVHVPEKRCISTRTRARRTSTRTDPVRVSAPLGQVQPWPGLRARLSSRHARAHPIRR